MNASTLESVANLLDPIDRAALADLWEEEGQTDRAAALRLCCYVWRTGAAGCAWYLSADPTSGALWQFAIDPQTGALLDTINCQLDFMDDLPACAYHARNAFARAMHEANEGGACPRLRGFEQPRCGFHVQSLRAGWGDLWFWRKSLD
jgi:hypothetical protein